MSTPSSPRSTLEGELDVSAVVPGAVCHRGITFVARRGFRPLLMDVYVPVRRTPPVPCVLWIHGGAWLEGDRREQPEVWPKGGFFRMLIEAGLAVATVDYRLSGEARWPAQFDDVAEALRFLRAHADVLGVAPGRIGVGGDSAGGHLAAMLALTGSGPTAVQAAAILYGVMDLRDFEGQVPAAADPTTTPEAQLMGATADEAPEAFAAASPITHAHAGAPPMLLITGDSDLVVPPRQSVRLRDGLVAAGARDVVLDLVPGADHCFGGVDAEVPLRRVVAFLAERLTADRLQADRRQGDRRRSDGASGNGSAL